MERDVIVVGAGPGGATTAAKLAQQGFDVLLIDRKTYPRDKTCGDAIPCSAVERLYDLGMREKFDNAGFYPVNKLLLSTGEDEFEAELNKGRQYGVDSYIVPRLQFDVLIQQHAIDSGAEFCLGQVKEPLIEEGEVVGVRVRANGKTQDIRSRVVVGADGVTSVITRNVRPKNKQHINMHRAVALRAYIDDFVELPHQVEFYLYKGILPGYAWVFPYGEGQANIGLGMRLDMFRREKRSLEDMLKQFMEMPAIKSRLKEGGKVRDVAIWQLNFGSQKKLQHAFAGCLLVGDAAGFINPLTGGGIDHAIASGYLAAQTIQEAFDRHDFSQESLAIYEKRCHEAMWDGLRRSFYIQRAIGMFPILVRYLIRRGNKEGSFAQSFLTKL